MIWLFITLILTAIFVAVPVCYFLYMKRVSQKPWPFKVNENFYPFVSLLVPARNEEELIEFKLKNLMRISYPKDKIEIIIVNDGSTDGTVAKANEFKLSHPDFDFQIISTFEHKGKAAALNLALEQAKGEIIAISDADCFTKSSTLNAAIPFFADSSVGAISGFEMLLNSQDSWVTETELAYNDIVHTIRVGESKTHSTLFFQGGFGAYRRNMLDKFDLYTDDSGTALKIIQNGGRVILLPEAIYFTTFSVNWKGKFVVKLRRATQLVNLWFRCVNYSSKKELKLPKKIFAPEALQYLVSPFIFVAILIFSLLTIIAYPFMIIALLCLLLSFLAVKRVKTLFVEVVQDNIILFCAIFFALFRKFPRWSAGTSRVSLTEAILERNDLL